jgi:hypothetical protein
MFACVCAPAVGPASRHLRPGCSQVAGGTRLLRVGRAALSRGPCTQEMDPDLVARSEACDMPFEPVYVNEDGSWSVPELAYHERRTEWQKWIDQTVFKQE